MTKLWSAQKWADGMTVEQTGRPSTLEFHQHSFVGHK